jgi:hypothetical protein
MLVDALVVADQVAIDLLRHVPLDTKKKRPGLLVAMLGPALRERVPLAASELLSV